MYSAQQPLIDKFIVELSSYFTAITNASFAPDDKTLARKLPALAVAPMDVKREQPTLFGSSFIINEQAYALTVIVAHEVDAATHEQTEIIGGGLMLKVIQSAVGFKPTGFRDAFVLISEFNPAPFYSDELGIAAFTRAVRITEILKK